MTSNRSSSPHYAGLQSGDIVFISVVNPPFGQVARDTGSPATHVGVIFAAPAEGERGQGGWLVAESTIPWSRYTPLDRFLARSHRGWHAIRRVRGGLSGAQVMALRRACDARMGLWYHFGFRYDSPRQFCSKFVHEVFREAAGIEVGRIESFGDLFRRYPRTALWFWRLWFLGRIPWRQRTITPASQMLSPALDTVLTSPMPMP